MIKVAYLLGSLNRGGTETLLLDVLGQPSNTPFEMILIYRKNGELIDNFKSLQVPVYHVKTGPKWLFWIYLFRLRHLLQQQKPDIIHAQQSLDAVYAFIACLGLPVKIVQTFHGYDFGLGYFNRLMIRISQKLAHMNVFVSKSQFAYYRKKYQCMKNTKCKVVYNGINFDKFHLSDVTSIRNELEIKDDALLLGMVGSFVNVRDQMTVCRFLKKLSQQHINFIFLFIGNKDEKIPALYDDCVIYCNENGFGNNVLFIGSRSDIPVLLPQLDAFVYSTDHDTFGLAVLEAIASGIPVFVNDREIMMEITDNGKYATVYHTKDENDLLKKFEEFLGQPRKFEAEAKEHGIWARKTYNIQAHCDMLLEVYRQLILKR